MADFSDVDIEALVDWQLSRQAQKQAPYRGPQRIGLCRWCGTEWHGMPRAGCGGSFVMPDTPKRRRNSSSGSLD